jgi:hypothetical protein
VCRRPRAVVVAAAAAAAVAVAVAAAMRERELERIQRAAAARRTFSRCHATPHTRRRRQRHTALTKRNDRLHNIITDAEIEHMLKLVRGGGCI